MARVLYVSHGLKHAETIKEDIEKTPDRNRSETGDQVSIVGSLDQALTTFDDQGPFDFIIIEFKLASGRNTKESPGALFLHKLKFRVPKTSTPVAVLTQDDDRTTYFNLIKHYPHVMKDQIYRQHALLRTVVQTMKSRYCPSDPGPLSGVSPDSRPTGI